ncbi:MAG: HAMP domain-containing sensor histidine kinase [Pseudomonadota bacterium]
MFSNLRYFAAGSLLIVVLGALALSLYFNQFKQSEFLDTAKTQLESTVKSYTAVVWNRYAAEIIANPNSPYLSSFEAETELFFKQQPLAKITIFSPDVMRLYYSSSNAYATSDGTTRITLFDLNAVKAGGTSSRVVDDVYLTGSDKPGLKRMMLQTIVPLKRTAGGQPEALAEIYIDMTSKWDMLAYRLHVVLGTMIGTFMLLLVILLFTASRAESIITKQHEVNLELIAAASQAEAQSRDKSQFLASVSHELRTPLNAIIGFSEIIRNEAKDKLDKIYQEYVEDIFASGKHLLSLINDILDFSKAEAGKLQIEWAETDATKVIRNSLRMVLPRAETAQVTLVEDIPAQHLVIVTDAKKLKQVLLNLLSNAVKFTPAGGEVRCHAWVDVITGALNIQVRDTGIGILPKDISRVMTPFGQVDSALSRKYEGTGLGLPLSKKFVESMGGNFTIESEIKVGTSITITFPKAPAGWGSEAMQKQLAAQEYSDVPPEA